MWIDIDRTRFAHRRGLACAVQICMVLASLTVPAGAATTNWTADTGDWFTPGNWDNGVPGLADSAIVSNGDPAQFRKTAQINAAASFHDLTISGSLSASVFSLVELVSGGSFASGSGDITIQTFGGLTFSNNGTPGSIVNNVSVAGAGDVRFNRSDTVTFAGIISGAGGIDQSGGGTTILTGANTYTGLADVLAGTLQLGNGGTTGSLAARSTIGVDGNFAIDRSDAVTIANMIEDSGTLSQIGSGTTTLTGNNSYTGGTIITAGVLSIDNDVELGNNNSAVTLDGGTLRYTAQVIDAQRFFRLGAGGGTFDMASGDGTSINEVISGSGGLNKTGAGYLNLQAAETYTGGTTITDGTLSFSFGGTLAAASAITIIGGTFDIGHSQTVGALSGSGGAIMLGAYTLTVNSAANTTLASAISDDGSSDGALVKQGTGTLTLTGTNTYLGGTTISAGTLQIGNGGGTGTLVGAVLDNGALIFNRSDVASFASAIFGTGSVTITGGGARLTGTNTYTGGTTINAGTLQLGNGGTTGSIVGTVADNGALVFDRSDIITFGGDISGTGSVKIMGGGALLKGTGTYSGGTTIVAASALIVGSGGTTGSIVGNVADNGALYFFRSDSYVFSGTISGAGSVVQVGDGGVYLTGINTYSGGTTISNSALALGAGGTTGSIAGNVVDNGALYFFRSDPYLFAGIISGSGVVIQSDTGGVYLTAANTYSGGTSIASGSALALGTGGTTGSIVGNVVDNGALYIFRSDSYVFAGAISGSGAVLQVGSGGTSLTGNNTYSGGTTIVSGSVLAVGSGGTTGSIVGNVLDNGGLYFYRSDSYSFGGAISGTGSVLIVGSGGSFLTGNSSYSGGTTIFSGAALILGAGGTTGSLVGNVADNGALYFDRSDALTLAGTISGTGVVIQVGPGTTSLAAANSYNGGTIVSAGTVEAKLSASFGTGAVTLNGAPATLLLDDAVNLHNTVNIVSPSFIDVNASDVAALSGPVVGSAPFEKDGTGMLIMNHDNRPTYSGNISYHGTLVEGVTGGFGTGTVTVLGSTLVLENGVIHDNRTVLADDLNVVQEGGIAAIAAPISQTGGPWGLIKAGGGTLVLAGDNSFTGRTTVAEGTLILAGTLAGSAMVGSNATLALSGRIAGDLVVQPGGALSSLAASGGLSTLSAASYRETAGTLAIRFGGASTGNASDRLAVAGAASLQGGLLDAHSVTPAADFTFDQRYVVIAAGGPVSGQFANPAAFTANADDPALLQRLRYDLGGVVLEIRKPIDFTAAASNAATPGQLSVARAVNATELTASDAWANVVNALAAQPSAAASQNALSQMSGEGLVDAQRVAADSLDLFARALQSRLLDIADPSGGSQQATPLGQGGEAWITLLDRDEQWDAKDGHAAFHAQYDGFSAGLDTTMGQGLTLGVAAGTIRPSQKTAALATTASGTGTYFGAYGRYELGDMFVGVTVSHGDGQLDEQRTIVIAPLQQTVAGVIDQHETAAALTLGLRLPLLGGSFEPRIEASYLSAAQDAVAERDSGLGLALTTQPFSTEQLAATLGARWRIQLRSGSFWATPDIGGAISFSDNDTPSTTAAFSGAPAGTGSFVIAAAKPPAVLGTASAGIALGDDDLPIALHLLYQADFAQSTTQHNAIIRITFDW